MPLRDHIAAMNSVEDLDLGEVRSLRNVELGLGALLASFAGWTLGRSVDLLVHDSLQDAAPSGVTGAVLTAASVALGYRGWIHSEAVAAMVEQQAADDVAFDPTNYQGPMVLPAERQAAA